MTGVQTCALPIFLKLVEQRPEDYFVHQEFGVFLEVSGDPAGALAEWQRFRDMLPQDSLGHYQTGRLLITQQRYAEAEAALRKAVAAAGLVRAGGPKPPQPSLSIPPKTAKNR